MKTLKAEHFCAGSLALSPYFRPGTVDLRHIRREQRLHDMVFDLPRLVCLVEELTRAVGGFTVEAVSLLGHRLQAHVIRVFEDANWLKARVISSNRTVNERVLPKRLLARDILLTNNLLKQEHLHHGSGLDTIPDFPDIEMMCNLKCINAHQLSELMGRTLIFVSPLGQRAQVRRQRVSESGGEEEGDDDKGGGADVGELAWVEKETEGDILRMHRDYLLMCRAWLSAEDAWSLFPEELNGILLHEDSEPVAKAAGEKHVTSNATSWLPSFLIRYLCARAGIVLINDTVYDVIRGIAKTFLENLVHNAITVMQHRCMNREVVNVNDMVVMPTDVTICVASQAGYYGRQTQAILASFEQAAMSRDQQTTRTLYATKALSEDGETGSIRNAFEDARLFVQGQHQQQHHVLDFGSFAKALAAFAQEYESPLGKDQTVVWDHQTVVLMERILTCALVGRLKLAKRIQHHAFPDWRVLDAEDVEVADALMRRPSAFQW